MIQIGTIVVGGNMDNPFKPNNSRVDKLENQIINLRERVAKLERDLHFFFQLIHLMNFQKCRKYNQVLTAKHKVIKN